MINVIANNRNDNKINPITYNLWKGLIPMFGDFKQWIGRLIDPFRLHPVHVD
jgi:hypothetical protein